MKDLEEYTNKVKRLAHEWKEEMKSQFILKTKSNPREKRNRKDRTKSIASALSSRVRLINGSPEYVTIEWKGAIQAIFVEYGAGKGHLRIDGKLMRGKRIGKNYKPLFGPLRRKPKPIISSIQEEMANDLLQLAGKAAMQKITNAMEIKL